MDFQTKVALAVVLAIAICWALLFAHKHVSNIIKQLFLLRRWKKFARVYLNGGCYIKLSYERENDGVKINFDFDEKKIKRSEVDKVIKIVGDMRKHGHIEAVVKMIDIKAIQDAAIIKLFERFISGKE